MSICVVIGPDGLPLEALAVPYDGHTRHFMQGPADLLGVYAKNLWKLQINYGAAAPDRDTFRYKASELLFSGDFTRWRLENMRYTIEPVQETKSWLFTWRFRGGGDVRPIQAALANYQGWSRSGVTITQVLTSSTHVEVEIVPSIPGFPAAAGLYRWGQGNNPEVLLVASYLRDPVFAEHLVNHEFGHAIFRIWDMIPERGFPYYSGIMDYTGVEQFPIEREIQDVGLWLRGQGVVQ